MDKKMNPKEFRDFMEDQRHEIEKYKWCLGVELHHDPLADRSYNDICKEWIQKFSIQFRKEWKEKRFTEE